MQSASGAAPASAREVPTAVIEELMSITDGQVVFERERDAATQGVLVNPNASCSRIGTRAYAGAMEELAAQLRFDLAQANDAARFAADPSDPRIRAVQESAARIRAALAQAPGSPLPLGTQVVHLLALRAGLLDRLPVEAVQERLAKVVAAVPASTLQQLDSGARLSPELEKAVLDTFV